MRFGSSLVLLLAACGSVPTVPAELSRINRAAIVAVGDCKDHVRAVKRELPDTKTLITCFNMRTDCHASAVVEAGGETWVLDNGDLRMGRILPLGVYKEYMRKRPGAKYGIFGVEILDHTKR